MYPLSDNKAATNDGKHYNSSIKDNNIDKEIIESTSCVIDRKLYVPKNI
jgi:hypothetical protein